MGEGGLSGAHDGCGRDVKEREEERDFLRMKMKDEVDEADGGWRSKVRERGRNKGRREE